MSSGFSGDSSELSSPVTKAGVGESIDSGVEKSKGCPLDSPSPCMGNLRSGYSPHKHATDLHRDSCLDKVMYHDGRENVGDSHSANCEEREDVGSDSVAGSPGRPEMESVSIPNSPKSTKSNSPRPSYITTRPKRSKGPFVQPQGVRIPDLNLGAAL
ncbi:hypothetical protein Hanom_Chr09g00776101 [Helianthus anomalus]